MAEAIKTKYRVGGMDCAACASKIENAVSRIPGVSEVGASYTAGTLNVVHDNVPFIAIQKAIKPLGYTVAPSDAPAPADHFELSDGPWWKTRKAVLTIACGLALLVAYLVGQVFPAIGHWAFLAALLVG